VAETAVTERLRHLEQESERNITYRHDLRNEIAGLKTQNAVIIKELETIRREQEDQALEQEKRDQKIGRGLMYAGTTFLTLAGIVASFVIQGG
jgi:hypothetical protein